MLQHLPVQSKLIIGLGLATSILVAVYKMKYLPISIAVLISFALASYNVNCVIRGHCSNWAWLITAGYLINAGYLIYLALKKDDDKLDGMMTNQSCGSR